MKTLDEKIREFAHELFGYDDDIVDYTAIESFYDGANFVKDEMQKEIDEWQDKVYHSTRLVEQLQLELKNKDAVRLWNENEKLKALLAKAVEGLKEVQTRTAHMDSKHAGKINRYVTENLTEIKKEMDE